MKHLHNIVLILTILFLFNGCKDGIDEITQVDPGADTSAPVIKINRPLEGTQIKVPDVITSITIDFEITDDIEIQSVVVLMDGAEIASYSEFKDYRRFLIKDLVYDNVTTGNHELTITATDLDSKSTSASVTFEKVPPYVPKYDGEIFYMPFDGDFTDLVSITSATEVGSPGFAGTSIIGNNAYQGTTDSYLTFPTDGLLTTNEFSAAFWYKVSGTPDRAGVLVIGDDADDRRQGFRLFREGNADEQRIKANVGVGGGESWNDGAVINVANGEWVHVVYTISETESKIYFNGVQMNNSTFTTPVDWTDCETITIGAGGDTFSYWNHLSDNSAMDELRLFNKALTLTDIQSMINEASETLYMPFNGNYTDLVRNTDATEVGSPGFGTGKDGESYVGATDAYLTLPTVGLTSNEFTAAFWYKLNADPDRAGILVIGPPDPDNPDAMNNRNAGFRFFRENAGGMQRFKLNVGTGSGDSWFDGGAAADIDPSVNDWVHLAFTISDTECVVYINGEIAAQGSFNGIDWTDCDILSIMSGAPRFTGWNHRSDSSSMDELRLYNKVLTQTDIQAMLN